MKIRNTDLSGEWCYSANITLRRGVIWDLAQSARKIFQSARKNWNHTRRSRMWFQIFPCSLKAKSQITPLHRVMFAINTTTLRRRVCFNPKRTENLVREKPCALGFSVRFGLKHTLRCVIWVKSWKLEAQIWAHNTSKQTWKIVFQNYCWKNTIRDGGSIAQIIGFLGLIIELLNCV